jgi:hypothetical protein
MSYYDPWTHALKLFLTRLIQFIAASLLLGLGAWHLLLRLLGYDFLGSTRIALSGNILDLRAMLGLCLIIGALLTGWLFTWLMLRWPARNRGADRHHRGARVIDTDEA